MIRAACLDHAILVGKVPHSPKTLPATSRLTYNPLMEIAAVQLYRLYP